MGPDDLWRKMIALFLFYVFMVFVGNIFEVCDKRGFGKWYELFGTRFLNMTTDGEIKQECFLNKWVRASVCQPTRVQAPLSGGPNPVGSHTKSWRLPIGIS